MRNKYTKELLLPIIEKSKSWREVCEYLNLVPATGSQVHIQKRAKNFGISWSHFPGQAHRKGKVSLNKKPIEFYLKKDLFVKSHGLRIRLIKERLKEGCCEVCGLFEWLGEEIVLELDHIDNNHTNNELENLMIVCPNCHALKTRKAAKNRRISRKNGKRGSEVDKRTIRKSRPKTRKIVRPSLEILLEEVKNLGYCATARNYGVSDNCIRKWIDHERYKQR